MGKKESLAREARPRFGPGDVLLFSAWCGLVAGELEVAARVLHRNLSSTDRLYLMTRHFVWLGPLVSLVLFLSVGLLLAGLTRLWPRQVGWLSPRLLCTWAVMQVLVVVGRGIYTEAWLILAMGVALRLAPFIERHAPGMGQRLRYGLPILLGLVLVQGGLILGQDWLAQWRENCQPLPAAGAPNVLVIVLDTVRADHLSLYGHSRATSPALARFAARGVRFDQARATAPWTLASHASLFTGRWPHELGVHWMWPLGADFPTLAEYLGSLGYATAGFVGNTFYCSYDSGLNRGFTHYEDYVLDPFTALRTVHLVDLSLKALAQVIPSLGRGFLTSSPSPPRGFSMRQFSYEDRKNAEMVNHEFLSWLSKREPRRPFFAFLNFVDAHLPYVLPPGAAYRFGTVPESEADFMFLLEGWFQVDRLKVSTRGRALARDSYDNCLAYLDDRLGELFDELERQGVLDQTLVIVTADHGEGLGEHDLFDHGESLYSTEIRVPLVIVPPLRDRSVSVVKEVVSLRDLAATIADFANLAALPFPGQVLPGLGRKPPAAQARRDKGSVVLSELSAPNPIDPNQGRSPAIRGPLVSLAEGDFVYIRNQGDGVEQLFNERDDPRELVNRAHSDAMALILGRFRDQLARVKSNAPARPR